MTDFFAFDTFTGDSGIKTASFNGAMQTNYGAHGVVIAVLLGTVSGTSPTLSIQFQFSPDGGTTWVNIGPALTNLTASNQKGIIIIYPTNISQAIGATPVNLVSGGSQTMGINFPLPHTWRLTYTIGGTTPSFTINSVAVSYLV